MNVKLFAFFLKNVKNVAVTEVPKGLIGKNKNGV